MDISEKTHVKYSLSWSDHLQAISNGLCSLQQNEELVDMTLAADGHYVKVHRVIMAMASPYMKDLICSIKCNHPVIFLNNLSYNTLTYILEYIYTGKVDIPSEFMDEFLIAGRSLHIKGLKDVNVKDEDIIIPVKDTDMDQVKMSKCYTEAATKNEREVLDLELIKENMKESLTKSIGSLEVETIEEDGEIIVDTENPDCGMTSYCILKYDFHITNCPLMNVKLLSFQITNQEWTRRVGKKLSATLCQPFIVLILEISLRTIRCLTEDPYR
ncbi:longitudinals lacking protein, isoforms H/M/V isoform X2 [Pieris rapae]|uniref:longitudinals lacking protein, isoforms H/M/V isoform X2 n=1 Tax=Pieris rapae TaxID=64459 RepID=UPI001E281A56|nr:longitudinals lacking protein, isoforms H/M/V isoform X2 [Pieris rapae]